MYSGANDVLGEQDILENETLFCDTEYCLLQTEINQSIALCAAKMARKHRAKVILKPCAISQIDAELLQYVDILVPNRKEACKLLPHLTTVEEQAKWFLEHGAGTVIITLGENGCYKRDSKSGAFFPAARTTPVDATGAADAFIASLAVYLSNGKDLTEAIKYATCAGSLATMRYGVPPALVNKDDLETFYSTHVNELEECKA